MIDKTRIQKAVKEILLAIGENPEREGLLETPARVADMYEEIFSGLHLNPADEIKIFKEEYYNDLVVVKDIPLYSVCEHHLIPFFGVAYVVYLPSQNNILGLSKIARIVDLAAKKKKTSTAGKALQRNSRADYGIGQSRSCVGTNRSRTPLHDYARYTQTRF